MLKHQGALGSLWKQSAALNAVALTLFFAHRLDEMEVRTTEAMAAAKRADSEELRLQTLALMGLKHLCYGELAEGKTVLDDIFQTSRAINYKPTLTAGLVCRGCRSF